ncbi:hypothetical protein NEOLEDRAFT_699775 [Neolentinus lepideus HHB14362 ss-1]|uniref:Uncharacterized protein n=1 Tax=Neolentinus lepideus HHB14362 ss-1 TaxID=1314782 RepID=A0A165V3K4_9AGAM|nr:hypothetical protein NEOLEDRAFT_699775 [Neolentinus lepideus HHB14362 ss-1]
MDQEPPRPIDVIRASKTPLPGLPAWQLRAADEAMELGYDRMQSYGSRMDKKERESVRNMYINVVDMRKAIARRFKKRARKSTEIRRSLAHANEENRPPLPIRQSSSTSDTSLMSPTTVSGSSFASGSESVTVVSPTLESPVEKTTDDMDEKELMESLLLLSPDDQALAEELLRVANLANESWSEFGSAVEKLLDQPHKTLDNVKDMPEAIIKVVLNLLQRAIMHYDQNQGSGVSTSFRDVCEVVLRRICHHRNLLPRCIYVSIGLCHEQRIAHGGSGSIYSAELNGQVVAVKTFHTEKDVALNTMQETV